MPDAETRADNNPKHNAENAWKGPIVFLGVAIRAVPKALLWALIFASHAPATTSAPQGQRTAADSSQIDVGAPDDGQPHPSVPPINGSQPHTTTVNQFRGEYSPQVPLAVLPARGGLEPELNLVYSAQRGDGAYGSGWQLSFMSTVERRAIGGGTPDMYGVLDDPSGAFEFRIDGALLVPNPAGDGTYRAEHDAFTVYEPVVHWALINRVVAWRVRRGGVTRTYGSDADAGLCQSGVEYAAADCIEPVRWYLTRIENAQGNVIDIEYESLRLNDVVIPQTEYQQTLDTRTTRLLEARFGKPPTGHVSPQQRGQVGAAQPDVSVGGSAGRAIRQDTDHVYADPSEEIVLGTDTHKLLPVALHYNDGTHTVQLVYENRPDVRAERQDGIERVLGKRLSRIDVKATRDDGDHLAYRYRFNYKQAASDGRSLLSEVRQESVDSTDLADTTVLLRRFEYADHALSTLSWADWTQLKVTGMSLVPDHYDFSDGMKTKAYSSTSILVNVDADAQPDLIVLNTDCEADPPHSTPDSDAPGPRGGGSDPRGVDVVDIPKTALSQCKSDHRVYLNQPDGTTGRKFVYDENRSDQLNARLGPLQQVTGSVDFLIVDINGDGIADLVTGDIDNSRDPLGVDHRFYAGGDKGWSGKGEDLPWATTLGGHNPFRELQLADMNGDGKPDLIGDTEYFLNTGTAPFFASESVRPLQVYNKSSESKDLPTDLPPNHPDAACMGRDDDPRFVEMDLGVFHGFSSTAYRGTEDTANLVSPQQWVWRHTSYGDFNGDGVADRVVALSWPESAEISRDIGSTPIWKDSKGRCGGINRVYLGNGRGQFYETDMTIGGLYAWPGGPRAEDVSRNDVQTAPAVTFEYTPPVNQQAMVDLDGDGRAEMIQVCGTDWAHAIPDKGGTPAGYHLSENSTECPSGTLLLPAMWTGSSALLPPYVGSRDDMVLGGYYDVDGNGLADVYVAANPVHPTDWAKAGGESPYWRRSTLAAPQGRLTAIIGPHGGRTELTWAVVNEGGINGARMVQVIGAIDDADGRTNFKFSSPVFDGRFVGFQHAEASGTSGITQVTQFATDLPRQGATDSEAVTNEQGLLHHLTVHLDRLTARQVALDAVAPYFNPVYRTCSFEFANDTVAKDPAIFVNECAAFDGKEGPRWLPSDTPTSTSLPNGVSTSNAAKPTNTHLAGGDRVRKPSSQGTDSREEQQHVATGPDAEIKLDPLYTDNRMRVTEFDWEQLSGVLLEERDYNDVTTVDDTTVSTYTYHPWNDVLATRLLYTRQTHDVSPHPATIARGSANVAERAVKTTPIPPSATRRYFEYPLEDYVGIDWGREIQWTSPPAAPGIPSQKRSRTRTFNHGAVVAETAWGETRTVNYTIDPCGQVARRSTTLGWESVQRDELCREIKKETNHGRQEHLTYDGFNRIRSDIVAIVQADGSTKLGGSTRYDYDVASATGEPARVEIKDGGSGAETAAKTYLDEFGRPWKQVVCERDAAAADTWTHNMDEAYACVDDANKVATTITLYDALSGLEGFRSLPFSASEGTATLGSDATYPGLTPTVQLTGVAGTRSQYERYGRLREQTMPDGRLFSHSYDLGRETTAGDGIIVDLEMRGVGTTLLRNGAVTQSTSVNAFDEQVEVTDALGMQSTYSYDSWGRRVATGAPETDVWERCEGRSVRKVATERVTYSDNDEVLTITDALGEVITKHYDEHGRVIEIIGPDGITQETRVYEDAYKPPTFPDLPNGPKDPKPAPKHTRSVQTSDGMGNTYTVWIDALDRTYRQRAPDGTQSVTEYDERGREWRRTSPTGEVVTMTYDWLDRAIGVEVDSGTSKAVETREYDARGNLLRAVDADGELRLRTYDVMSRLLTESIGDPAKRVPMTVKRNRYDTNGRLAETRVNGVRTAFRYDEAGRLVRKFLGYDPTDFDPTGFDPTQYDTALMRQDIVYTVRDEVETTTDKRGEGVRSVYDERGRVVARETLFNGQVLGRRETGYDSLGRPVRVVDELGSVACTTYDDYGRISSITPAGLGTKRYRYTLDAPHPLTGQATHSLRTRLTAATGETFDTYVDAMGRNWLTSTSANGYQQITYIDGRATRIERIGLDGTTAAIKLYSYNDRSSRVARESDWFAPADEAACAVGAASCPSGAVNFAYTAGGRRVSQTDAAGNATITRFTEDGTMLPASVDASGFAVVRFEYDPSYPVVVARERGPQNDAIRTEYTLDRYLYQIRSDTLRKKTGQHEQVDYSYDASGHRLTATLHRDGRLESRLSWSYDDYGRTQSKMLDIPNAPVAGSGRIEWQYTPTGQLALVTYPSGNQVSYDYDSNGLLQRIEAGFGPGATTIATYDKPDASGRYLSARVADALTVKHVYDGGHESERSIHTGAGDIVESYRYDTLGRLTEAKHRAEAGDGRRQSGATLAYDVRDQLTLESRDGADGHVSLSYGHDTLGRRVSKITATDAGSDQQDYGYGSGSRLQMVTSTAATAIQWDAFDRPQNDQHNDRFVWGLADHLRSITTPDGRHEDMLFDADGQRVARSVGDAFDLYYSSDLSGEVYTQRRADGHFVDVVRDPNDGVIALLSDAGEIIPWTAGKGDTTMAAGADGRALESTFGEVDSSSLAVELGFHQTWGSALTPLRFAGVRVYDPETGRFLTPDPLGLGSATDPNDTVDLFGYALNNPVTVRDSTGYLGITPPSPTTIIVDGVAIETYNVNAWSNGTIRVANYAAYIAGVRAGIKMGLAQGWTLDQAVQYAIGNGPPSSANDDKGNSTGGGRAGGLRLRSFGPFNFFAHLFGGRAASAGAPVQDQESEVHSKASVEALEQARSGGPANGQFIDENGKIVRQVSGADPTSRAYWLRVTGPNGEEVMGADTREIISKFFAENPGYKPASKIFSSADVLTIEVSPPPDNRPGVVRFGSGVSKAAGGLVVELYNFMIHDNFGAWITMGGCYMGYSCSFVPKSGFWRASNDYMNHGYSYPGAVAMVMSDGMFYGSFGAMEGIGLGAQDGDWERVGENTFTLGATVAGAAIGGVEAGLAAPTTETSLLGGLTLEGADNTMMLGRRGRVPTPGTTAAPAVVESVGPQVAEILRRPLLLHDASGNLRGVFFGPVAERLRGNVAQWMNDGILSDALHIGGFDGDAVHSFSITLGGRELDVSATQLFRALKDVAPGTGLTYDHLLTCRAAQPGGAASLFARLRGRMVLGYDEVVGENGFGRYITDRRGGNPLPEQHMILLDQTGAQIGVEPFVGMRSSGLPAVPLDE